MSMVPWFHDNDLLTVENGVDVYLILLGLIMELCPSIKIPFNLVLIGNLIYHLFAATKDELVEVIQGPWYHGPWTQS